MQILPSNGGSMSNKVVITGINTDDLPKLSAKESQELLIRIKQGETDLRKKFLEGNVRLVLSMVQRFKTEKESADDLFQVGMLGLIKALDNFDTRLNVRFSTYAVPMICGEIRRYIRENSGFKVGRGLRDIAYRAMQARDRLEIGRSTEATLTEIAAEIDVPVLDVVGAMDAITEPVSLYDAAYGEEDGACIVDQVSDGKNFEDVLDRVTLKNEIKKLPEKEKEVIFMRYYEGRTQTEISRALSVSQAQVSRLEKSAVERLREAF